MKLTLVNHFHNTKVSILVNAEGKDGAHFIISAAQQRGIKKGLCPHGGKSCGCGVMTTVSKGSKFDYVVYDEKPSGDQLAYFVERF